MDHNVAWFIISFVKYRLVIPLLALLLFLLAGIIYLWGTPRLVEISPAQGETGVSASAPLRLTFSRRMRAEDIPQRLSIIPARQGNFTWEGSTLVFAPEQPWPNGMIVTVRLAPGARAAGLLAFRLADEVTGSFTVRQPRLVYLSPTDGPADLYVLDLQTRQSQRLTNTAGVTDFSLAANGTALVYTAAEASGSAIYRLELESGAVTTLQDCPQATCGHAGLSPQGNYLAYESTPLGTPGRPGITQVWLLPLREGLPGAESPRQVGAPASQTRQPLWSSQGILAYYDYDRAAWIFLDPAGGEAGWLADKTGNLGGWSPDGLQFMVSVVFPSPLTDPNLLPDLSAIPSSHLVTYHLAERREVDLTRLDTLEDALPAYSPDGVHVAFARRYLDEQRWTPGRQLWLMRTSGEDPRPLTSAPEFNHYGFAWSPAGEQLAYVRFNENLPLQPPEIWLIDADGSGAMRILEGGYAPLWIP